MAEIISNLICLGDSHVWVLDHLGEHGVHFEETRLEVVGVGGATAFGMANPNSATNALQVFREAIRQPDGALLLMIGEIDCGFLAWLRATQHGRTVDEELEDSFDRYRAFVAELRTAAEQVLLVTVPPPTVVDYSTWGGLDNARRLVTATIEERTLATRRYNDWIRALEGEGVVVVDVEDDCLDPLTGLVRATLRSSDPLDHHYDWSVFAPIMGAALRRVGCR